MPNSHYVGGDTRLGPWIYKTRAAIGRTLENLAKHASGIHKPFEWYGLFFLRLTQSISRQQELTADQVAARVAGSEALATGLVSVERAAFAHASYWQSEVMPLLEAGWQPPLAEGYRHFVALESIRKSIDETLDEAMREPKTDPYDSHPPLAERIAALQGSVRVPVAGDRSASDDTPLASTILSDQARLETDLLAFVSSGSDLKPIRWEEATEKVYLPTWRETTEQFRDALHGVTPPRLVIASKEPFGEGADWEGIPPEIRKSLAEFAFGSAFAFALANRGWTHEAMPGAPLVFRRGEWKTEPFLIIKRIESGELAAAEWEKFCANSGIAEMDLGAPAW